jgi:hypothetical protein
MSRKSPVERVRQGHKVLTYICIEYRAVSGVWGGGHTRWLERGGGGPIFWKTPDIGLASYSIISLRAGGSNASDPLSNE